MVEKETTQEREKEQNERMNYYLQHGQVITDKDGNDLIIRPRDNRATPEKENGK